MGTKDLEHMSKVYQINSCLVCKEKAATFFTYLLNVDEHRRRVLNMLGAICGIQFTVLLFTMIEPHPISLSL